MQKTVVPLVSESLANTTEKAFPYNRFVTFQKPLEKEVACLA